MLLQSRLITLLFAFAERVAPPVHLLLVNIALWHITRWVGCVFHKNNGPFSARFESCLMTYQIAYFERSVPQEPCLILEKERKFTFFPPSTIAGIYISLARMKQDKVNEIHDGDASGNRAVSDSTAQAVSVNVHELSWTNDVDLEEKEHGNHVSNFGLTRLETRSGSLLTTLLTFFQSLSSIY